MVSILLCSGESFISKQIKAVTVSDYSHAGIIINTDIGQLVIEAIDKGVSIIPLDQYFNNYKQTGTPYQGKLYKAEINLLQAQKQRVISYSLDQIGKEYDTTSIIKQAFNSFFGTDFEDKDNYRLICSELVYNSFNAAGIMLPKDKHGYCTPASIARDTRLKITKIK